MQQDVRTYVHPFRVPPSRGWWCPQRSLGRARLVKRAHLQTRTIHERLYVLKSVMYICICRVSHRAWLVSLECANVWTWKSLVNLLPCLGGLDHFVYRNEIHWDLPRIDSMTKGESFEVRISILFTYTINQKTTMILANGRAKCAINVHFFSWNRCLLCFRACPSSPKF